MTCNGLKDSECWDGLRFIFEMILITDKEAYFTHDFINPSKTFTVWE